MCKDCGCSITDHNHSHTHIDENGNDSPPVLLENLLFDKKAANIPEFFPNEKSNIEKMLDQFSQNALYYNRLAALNIQEKKYKDALLNIEKAIKATPNNNAVWLPGVMSRKKQIIPMLTALWG